MINEYIDREFIHPDIKIGYSLYAIRSSLLKAITSVRPQFNGIVVDLGCGEMPYKEFLLENKNITEYIGVDIEPTKYHNTVKPDILWDGNKIPLPDNYADWFILTEFLEHYFDTQHILKEVYRVLKPNGKIYFTVPFIWPLHEIPYDEYRFTPYSLEKHFKAAGFSETNIKPLGGTDRSLAIMIGIWMESYPTRSKNVIKQYSKKFLLYLLSKFYKYLLRIDRNPDHYILYEFISGLWGTVKK